MFPEADGDEPVQFLIVGLRCSLRERGFCFFCIGRIKKYIKRTLFIVVFLDFNLLDGPYDELNKPMKALQRTS